jgi:hypothetical protein
MCETSERFANVFLFLEENKDLKRIRERQTYVLDSFDPSVAASVACLCDSSRALFLLDHVKRAIKHFQQTLSHSQAPIASFDNADSNTDMQRRIQAWEMIVDNNAELAMDRTKQIQSTKRQPLAVVASLVDNVPNIAGLVCAVIAMPLYCSAVTLIEWIGFTGAHLGDLPYWRVGHR